MKLLKIGLFFNVLTLLCSSYEEDMKIFLGKDAFNKLKNLQTFSSTPQNSLNKNRAIAQLRGEAEESKNNDTANTSEVAYDKDDVDD